MSLSFLAALVAFVLSMISLAGATAERLASALEARLAGQVTIVVWGQGLESADAAAARAAERLAAQAGVRRATVLEADKSDEILGNLIAAGSPGGDGPRVLSLIGAPDAIPSAPFLKQVLAADRLVTAVDDHRGITGPLEHRALLGVGVAVVLGLAVVVGLFTASLVSGVGRVGAARARFDLMTRLGANPTFIGAMVGQQAGLMALAGGVVGTLFADVILFAAMVDRGFWRAFGAPAHAHPQLIDGLWTAAWPPVVAIIAAVGAGLCARRVIVRRERRI